MKASISSCRVCGTRMVPRGANRCQKHRAAHFRKVTRTRGPLVNRIELKLQQLEAEARSRRWRKAA